MTIDEAAKLLRDFHSGMPTSYTYEVRENMNEAKNILVAEYLRLTDPTPLTRELIEKELGKPDHVFAPSKSVEWTIGRHGVRWYYNRLLLDRLDLKFITTLGDLRQIVRMLRGGGN